MRLYIKYMVSLRCKMVVHQELEKLNISNASVELGFVNTLDDISIEQRRIYKLNYSSVAHLSNQFKKITELSPSFYKQLKKKRLKNLEDL